MSKRRIGIEIGSSQLRLAQFSGQGDSLQLERLCQLARDPQRPLAEQLTSLLERRLGFADRLLAVVPALQGYVRRLEFPFSDPRKVTAAARMELQSRLPLDITDHQLALGPLQAEGTGCSTLVASVPVNAVAAALEPFDAAGLPLQQLGLTPLSQAAVLARWVENGLMVLAHEQQLHLALLQHSQVVTTLSSTLPQSSTEHLARHLEQQARRLCHANRCPLPALYLLGDGCEAQLSDALRRIDLNPQPLPLPPAPADGPPLSTALLPVCLAALQDGEAAFNLRTGAFAPRHSLGRLKKHLIGGALLLTFSLLAAGSAALLELRHKQQLAQTYQQQLTALFRQTLPPGTAMVDADLQMRNATEQLRQISQQVGLDTSNSALALLRELSRLAPDDSSLRLTRFTYEEKDIAIDGSANSFDRVDRLAAELRKSPLLAAVRIADAKMALDGQQVHFRLQLTPTAGKGS